MTQQGEDREANPPILSICIVTFQARDLLRDCLNSIKANTHHSFEIIVTDNGSTDGTLEMLAGEFPEAQTIKNTQNLGYTVPMNQALRQARGQFLLQLNPDTLVLPGALDKLIDFMRENPDVGICGPKVLNRDGSMQQPCRRGEPRPWAVFSYFSGLARRYPRDRRFSEYLMTYMHEDETHPVAGVSGSCMLIRREVVNQIGFMDEHFFAYQEDADYCFQTRKAGWEVFYFPKAQITHFGGLGGSRVQPFQSIYQWHRSYFLYFRKNLAKDYFFLFNWIYYLAMFLKLILALLSNALRREKIPGTRRP